jgi:hypothetical protein
LIGKKSFKFLDIFARRQENRVESRKGDKK